MASSRATSGWGGRRPGAGRPRKADAVSHLRRGEIDPRLPLHLTLQVDRAIGSLRRAGIIRAIRAGLVAGGNGPDLRVIEFAAHEHRLHLVVEAGDAGTLSRAMQGLSIRLARRINAALGRTGQVFGERYQATSLATPAEVRGALATVLLGHVDPSAPRRERARAAIDPYSSAIWFDGWRTRPRATEPWQKKLLAGPRPTAPATLPLLADGWKKALGPLAPDELPGPPAAVH